MLVCFRNKDGQKSATLRQLHSPLPRDAAGQGCRSHATRALLYQDAPASRFSSASPEQLLQGSAPPHPFSKSAQLGQAPAAGPSAPQPHGAVRAPLPLRPHHPLTTPGPARRAAMGRARPAPALRGGAAAPSAPRRGCAPPAPGGPLSLLPICAFSPAAAALSE